MILSLPRDKQKVARVSFESLDIILKNRLDAAIYDHTLVSGLKERDTEKSEYYIALA